MALGLDPEAFWRQTPRRLAAVFAGKRTQLENEHNQRAWLAWHTAALARLQQLPDLATLQIVPAARDVEPQSEAESLAVFARLGATVSGAQPKQD